MSQDVRNKILSDAVKESASDPAYFCKFFLRKWFPLQMPPFHLGMLAMFTRKVSFLDKYTYAHDFLLNHFKYLADPSDPNSVELPVFRLDDEGKFMMIAGPNNAVIVPRGFSKTTLMNAANLYELLTDPSTFCVYVSESSDHAERQLGNIKRQLERNHLLREAYGNVVPKRSESEKWGADEIQLKNPDPNSSGAGAILLARGRGSQVRGLNYDGRRPNRILLDDVEDKESVATAAQRKKVSDWFYADVVPAGNEMDAEIEDAQQDLQITVLGTLLDAEALLMTLQKNDTFNHIRFGAVVEWNTKVLEEHGRKTLLRTTPRVMLWPDKMGVQTYLTKRNTFKTSGKLAEFTREYDSEIRVEEDAMFQYHNITLYLPTPLSALVQLAIACDPAISDLPGADSTAIISGGRRDDGLLWVLDEWGGPGITPREIVDKLFDLFIRYEKRAVVGIETQQYQKALVYLMREEMARRQLFFNVKSIYQGTEKNKIQRISGILQPRYANGYIRHFRPMPKIEAQLQDFPNGGFDFIDAEAMMFTLLGETAMLAAPEGTVTQDEYEALPPLPPSLYSSHQTYVFSGGDNSDPLKSGRYG